MSAYRPGLVRIIDRLDTPDQTIWEQKTLSHFAKIVKRAVVVLSVKRA